MSFTPGEMLRRAANAASSTVSSVASAATGGRRKSQVSMDGGAGMTVTSDMLQNVHDKFKLDLKSTPSKDALTTSHLSIRNGYLLKRNEQGAWQRRYVCVVPHFFMYYYDTDTSDAPRGVIDLELYDHLSKENNILKLSNTHEDLLRSFYFEDEDSDYLNEWINCLQRERYHAICDERDAYQQMQLEMSGALDSASSNQKEKEKEKEEVEGELRASNKKVAEAQSILQSMLVIVGITEEEMSKLTDLNKIGQALKSGILQTKARLERKIEEDIMTSQTTQIVHEQEIHSLTTQIQAEIQARKVLEDTILKERQNAEMREQEALSQVDNVNMDFQMALASKQAAEQKSTTLSEQKKILVKEVKQLRKKLEEMTESMEVLRQANERLSGAVMMQPGSEQHDRGVIEGDIVASASDPTLALAYPADGESVAPTSPSAGNPEERRGSGGLSPMFFSSSPVPIPSAGTAHVESPATAKRSGNLFGGLLGSSPPVNGAGTSIDMSDHRQYAPGIATGDEGVEDASSSVDRRSSRTSSGDVGIGSAGDATSSSSSSSRPSLTSIFSFGGGGGDSDRHHSAGEHTSESSNPTSYSGGGTGNRRSSLSSLTSMFSHSNNVDKISSPSAGGVLFSEDEANNNKALEKPPVHKAEGSKSSFFSSAFSFGKEKESVAADDAPGRMPSAQRLRCLRCDGTVEGPKYSTCKCDVPALNKEDLAFTATGAAVVDPHHDGDGEDRGMMSGMLKSARRMSNFMSSNKDASFNKSSHGTDITDTSASTSSLDVHTNSFNTLSPSEVFTGDVEPVNLGQARGLSNIESSKGAAANLDDGGVEETSTL